MKNILSIAFAVLAISFAQAQQSNPQLSTTPSDKVENAAKPQHRKHHKKNNFHRGGMQKVENTELREALEKYRTETMLPAMKEEHKTMLKNLSRADRKFLEQKREEKAQLHKKQFALNTAIRTARQQGASKEDIQAQFKTQKEALRAEHKAFFESMQEFVKRNEAHLQSTRENLKEFRVKAHENNKSVFQQFKPENTEKPNFEKRERPALKDGEKPNFEKRERPALKDGEKPNLGKRELKDGEKSFHGKHPHRHGKKHHKAGKKKGDKFVQFLLWDGEIKEKAPTKSLEVPQATLNTSVYPNPAQNITTLQVDLPKDVKSVQIRITDIQGKTVLTQTEKALNAGQQNIQLNVEKLPSGTYFYNIIADDLKTGSSLIIAK